MRYAAAVSVALAWLGAVFSEPALTAIGLAVLGFAYAAFDVRQALRGRVSALLLMSVFSGFAGLADLAGIMSFGTAWEDEFNIYAVVELMPPAETMIYLGTITMMAGYVWAPRSRNFWRHWPRVEFNFKSRHVGAGVAAAALTCTALMSIGVEFGGGTFGDVMRLAPAMGAFYLARLGAETRSRPLVALGMVVAVADSLRAVLFSYMRFGMVFPYVALALGVIVGGRSLRSLLSPLLLPPAIAILVMIPYAGRFAEMRPLLPTGLERLSEIRSTEGQDGGGWVATLARFATFNQTTQIMSLAESEGFLRGETFSYLSYAFIPRILWPSKPVIAKGQWFAEKLGLGYVVADTGHFSNSVNMTLAGELYLNFGWPGVVVGCFLAGTFVAVLWNLCAFSAGGRDLLSSLFGFRLMWGAWTLLGDLQYVVSLTAYYVIFAAVAWMLTRGYSRSAAAPPTCDGPVRELVR